MIKKFDDFIKESFFLATANDISINRSNLNLSYKQESFLYKFNNLIELLSDESGSMLNICQDKARRVTFNDLDSIIAKSLKESNLTLEDCINNKDIIIIDIYDSINGTVDVLLYKIFGNDYNLGNLGAFEEYPEEVLIKYSYGYHKTDYGRILLSQHFGSVDSFLDSIKKKILMYFLVDSEAFDNVDTLVAELEEELYLTTVSNNRVRVYFPLFYDMCYSSIIRGLESFQHDISYEVIKNFFITWVDEKYSPTDIQDEEEYIDIYI